VRLGYFLLVARFARVIALDTPHHVTQRGNGHGFYGVPALFTRLIDAVRPTRQLSFSKTSAGGSNEIPPVFALIRPLYPLPRKRQVLPLRSPL
jgi:hypothetical protein